MIRTIKLKFSTTEKVLAGALSIVALSSGAVLADQQPTGQTMAIESTTNGSQVANVPGTDNNLLSGVDGVLGVDSMNASTNTEQSSAGEAATGVDASHAGSNSSDQQGSGDVQENVSVTVDGKDVARDTFGSNDVSVNTTTSGSLDGSDNGTDVSIDRSVDQNTKNKNRVRNDDDIDTNIGDNDVSGNLNPVTVRNGNVKINFTLPH